MRGSYLHSSFRLRLKLICFWPNQTESMIKEEEKCEQPKIVDNKHWVIAWLVYENRQVVTEDILILLNICSNCWCHVASLRIDKDVQRRKLFRNLRFSLSLSHSYFAGYSDASGWFSPSSISCNNAAARCLNDVLRKRRSIHVARSAHVNCSLVLTLCSRLFRV